MRLASPGDTLNPLECDRRASSASRGPVIRMGCPMPGIDDGTTMLRDLAAAAAAPSPQDLRLRVRLDRRLRTSRRP